MHKPIAAASAAGLAVVAVWAGITWLSGWSLGLLALFIGTAVGAVQSLPPGVYIAMNGRIWDPLKVRKNVAANRFEPASG